MNRDHDLLTINRAALLETLCVVVKEKHFVWDPKEDTTRNQWLSYIHNTVPEQLNTNIGVCAAQFTESGRVAYNAVCTNTVSIKWSNSSFASDSQPVSMISYLKNLLLMIQTLVLSRVE